MPGSTTALPIEAALPDLRRCNDTTGIGICTLPIRVGDVVPLRS